MQLPEKVINNTNVLKVTELPVIPEDFICALSREMFFDPVLADDGFTYEKEEIEQYIATCLSENKKLTSPQTREEISGKLIQNKSMKSQVNSFLTKYPQHWENVYVSQSLRHLVLAKLDQANAKDLLALIDRDQRLLTEVFKEKNDKTILELICSQPSKELLQQTIKKLLPKDKKNIISFFKGREVFLFKLLVEHQDIDSIKTMGDILEWGHDFYVAQAYRALEEEDAKCLQTCLELEVSFKESSNNRPSLIHAAVIQNTPEMLEVICEYSEEALAYKEANGNTLLHIAAQANVKEIVQYLLDKDLDPLALNAKQQTPLQVAAYHQSITVLKLLLSVVDQYELLTLIHSHHGKAEIANVETAFGWDRNFYQRQARKAIIKKDLAILRLCCSMEIPLDAVDKNEPEVTLLHLAIATEFEVGAKFLLDAGALVSIDDEEGQTALHYAALYASESLLGVILHKAPSGLVMSKSHKLPIQLAIDKNREQPIIELLVKKFKPEEHNLVFILMSHYHGLEELKKISNALGWNKDWYFKMACQAIGRQNLGELSCCLTLGADITDINESGDSLLHIAVKCTKEENTNVIAYLLEQGVDGKQVDAKGKRAQELALSLNKRSVAQFIEKKRREIKLRPFIEPLQEQAKQAELKLVEEQAKQMQLKQQLDKTENTLKDQQAFIERQSTALQVLKNVSSLSFRINPLIIKGRNNLLASEENLEIIGLSAGRIVAINEKEEVQLWDGKTKQLIKSYKMIPTLLRAQQTIMQDLLKKAKDSDSNIRYIAVKALGKVKEITPEIIQVLLSTVKNEDCDVRQSAKDALNELKVITPETLHILLVAAKDNDENVRRSAKNALNKLEVTAPEILQILLLAAKDSDRNIREIAVKVLGNSKVVTPEIIKALLLAAKDDDDMVRCNAIAVLGNTKAVTLEIIQGLLTATKDNDRYVRGKAIAVLGNTKAVTLEIIQALLTAAKDNDEDVRRSAIYALSNSNVATPEIIQALLVVAKNDDSYVRGSAIYALGNLKEFTPEIAHALLIAAKYNDDWGLRRIAVEALGKSKEFTSEIVQALLLATKDDNQGVRHSAINALGKSKEFTSEIIQALISAAIKDNSQDVRRRANEVLSNLKEFTSKIIQEFLAAAKDDDENVRCGAVDALGKSKQFTSEIVQALLSATKDDNEKVRYSAIEVLSNLKEFTSEIIQVLITVAAKDSDFEIRSNAVLALSKTEQITPEIIEVLLLAAKDNDENVRACGVQALGDLKVNSLEIIETLLLAIKNDDEVFWIAVASLAQLKKITPDIIKAVLLRLNGRDINTYLSNVAFYALRNSEQITPEIIQIVLSALKDNDSEVRYSAVRALGKLNVVTPQIMQMLLAELKSKYDPTVLQIIIKSFDALNEIKNDLQEDYCLIEDVLLQRKSPQAQTFRN